MDSIEQIPDGELDGEAVSEEELAPQEGEEQAPLTVEDYAKARGWKPKDEWTGEGEHRSAQEYLDYGLDRAKDVSRDLKDLRKTTETMAQTQARIMREQVERARQEEADKWRSAHRQAVEDGDTEAAERAAEGYARASQPVQDDPSVQFAAENPWFNTDPQAKALAIATAETMRHLPAAEQLKAAQEAVHKRFPEYAPAKAAEPAKAVEVAKPAATTRTVKREKTFHDLPREAQEAARAMVAQGLLKNTDGYVRQYFNKEGTVE